MRFTIRDLLWLTLVVALVVAWGVSWNRWQGISGAQQRRIAGLELDIKMKTEAADANLLRALKALRDMRRSTSPGSSAPDPNLPGD